MQKNGRSNKGMVTKYTKHRIDQLWYTTFTLNVLLPLAVNERSKQTTSFCSFLNKRIPILALSWPFLMYSCKRNLADRTLVLPPIPITIAATIDDLPVPFGPIKTFKNGPGCITAAENVLCICRLVNEQLPIYSVMRFSSPFYSYAKSFRTYMKFSTVIDSIFPIPDVSASTGEDSLALFRFLDAIARDFAELLAKL